MLTKFVNCVSLNYKHTEADGSYYAEVKGDTLNLYFEGSNSVTDWIHNFYFPAKPYRHMNDGVWFCHRGFLKVWKSIEPRVKDNILDPNIKTINIVGYSHGAAIAQLCYEYVRFNRPDISLSGVGFGAPRVVWGFLIKRVRERFRGFVAVRNGNDIVTHLPPAILGFRHICKVKKIGKSVGLIQDHFPKNYVTGIKEEWMNGMH